MPWGEGGEPRALAVMLARGRDIVAGSLSVIVNCVCSRLVIFATT
jgi:hypothetical protein